MLKLFFIHLLIFICTFSFGQEDTIKKKFANIFGYPELHSVDSLIAVSNTDKRLVGKWILKKIKIYSENVLISENEYDITIEKEGFLLENQFQGYFIDEGDLSSTTFYWAINSKKDTIKIFRPVKGSSIDYRITPSFAFKIEKIRRNKLLFSAIKLRPPLMYTNRFEEKLVYNKEIYIFRRIRD
jgi:hypothetical protein